MVSHLIESALSIVFRAQTGQLLHLVVHGERIDEGVQLALHDDAAEPVQRHADPVVRHPPLYNLL